MKLHAAWLGWPETRTLIAAFAKANAPLRFVGGCVRDTLLGRAVQDIDAATPLPPEAVTALLAAAAIKAIPTGLAHGTVTALVDGRHFEITTLRRDMACDGRHAAVEFTDDWEEDAKRRDFTMNALYLSPEGELFDYFNGAEDARAGKVMFIGDAVSRIEEDALRILRFFRFYAYYGNAPMDSAALSACKTHASMIERLSGERIREEMFKLLISAKAQEALEAMWANGIYRHILPGAWNAALFAALTALEEGEGKAALAVRLALLMLMDAAPARALAQVRERWKLSNAMLKMLDSYLKYFSSVPLEDEAALKAFIRRFGNNETRAMLLLHAAKAALPKDAISKAIALARNWRAPGFPLTGGMLMEAGFKEGAGLGALLRDLEAYWEESDYLPDKKALLKRAPGRLKKLENPKD